MKTDGIIDRWKKLDINKKTFLVGGILVFLGLMSTLLMIIGIVLCTFAGYNMYQDGKKKKPIDIASDEDFKLDKKDGTIK